MQNYLQELPPDPSVLIYMPQKIQLSPKMETSLYPLDSLCLHLKDATLELPPEAD